MLRRELLIGVATAALLVDQASAGQVTLLGAGSAGTAAPPPAITRVNTATASATTVTVPAHLAGDLILVWAARGGSTTAPSLPSGYTSILTKASTSTSPVAARLGYKIATGTSDASGTWTNATQICCHVYRPPTGYTVLIGQSATSTSTTNTVTYPALTLADAGGNSWVVGFAAVDNTSETIGTAPAGMTNETSITGASSAASGHDTTAGVATWASTNVVTTGTAAKSVSATVEIVMSQTGSVAVAQVYQHVGGGGNPVSRNNSGNSFKLPLPNASGSGNTLVLGITYDAGATPSISDNVNGSWGAAAVTASGGTGNLDSKIFVLPNVASGQTTITVTFGAAVVGFQYCLTELYGIATASPTNGTTSAAFSTTSAAGSFTPGNNNANGGNFIWSYFAKADTIPAHQTTAIFASNPFKLLNSDIGWNSANDSITKAVGGYVQATSAAINPTITSVAESGDQWNCLAVALKLSSGAGTAPAAGIRINSIHHFASNHFPASGNYVLQLPFTGNLRVVMSTDPTLNAITVTDSEGNTWSQAGATGTWYLGNAAPNSNLMVYITGGGGSVTDSWRFVDLSGANASPFDNATANGQSVNGLSSFTASPSPAPTNTNGLVIANLELGQGPGLAVTAPTGAIWDLCTYTGETDLDLIENADIMAHFHNAASGAETWTFTITSQVSNSTSGGFICFKA